MSWALSPLGEVAEIVTGKTPSTTNEANFGGDIPFVTPADLDGGALLTSTPRTLSEIGAASIRLVPKNAILVGCIGTLGKVGMAGKPLATNQQINALVFDETRVWPRFGYYAARRLRPEMEMMAPATTVKIISKSKFSELKIPLPPLEEQKRIAGILDQADALRRLRTRALDKLNTLGQAIFHEMFGDIARNSMDWPIGCIGDLLEEAKYGSSAKANTEGKGLPMLRMGNLTYDGQIDLTSLKHVKLSDADFEKYTTQKGDLLFNRTNSKELVGKTAVVKQEEPIAFAGYLVRGRANKLGNTDYISAYLNSAHGKATLVGMCKNIVGMANINAKEMQKIRIAIPPKDLQDQFSVAIDALAPERGKLIDAIDLQDSLFASLQHRAFRGEL